MVEIVMEEDWLVSRCHARSFVGVFTRFATSYPFLHVHVGCGVGLARCGNALSSLITNCLSIQTNRSWYSRTALISSSKLSSSIRRFSKFIIKLFSHFIEFIRQFSASFNAINWSSSVGSFLRSSSSKILFRVFVTPRLCKPPLSLFVFATSPF